MIKRFSVLLFAFFLLLVVPLTAEIQEVSVEVRSAAFFHSSGRFREIYGTVGGCYQLEVSTPLFHCTDGWVNFDWFSKHKKSKECEVCNSRLYIANISCGVKFPYQFCEQLTAYLGIGPSFSRVWLRNKSKHDHERVTKLAVGGVLKSGVVYFINACMFIDLFVDYLYQPVHFEKHVDIGGLKTGAGIGLKF